MSEKCQEQDTSDLQFRWTTNEGEQGEWNNVDDYPALKRALERKSCFKHGFVDHDGYKLELRVNPMRPMRPPETIQQALQQHDVRCEVGHDRGQSAIRFVEDCRRILGVAPFYTQQAFTPETLLGFPVIEVDMPLQPFSGDAWFSKLTDTNKGASSDHTTQQ